MIQEGLLKKSGKSLHLLKGTRKEGGKRFSPACSWWYPTREKKYKVKGKIELQEYKNTGIEIDKEELYELDKLSLDDSHREWNKLMWLPDTN